MESACAFRKSAARVGRVARGMCDTSLLCVVCLCFFCGSLFSLEDLKKKAKAQELNKH